MGKSGFLDDIDLQIIRGDEGKSRSKKSKQKLFTCADCGLNMQCQTPQFPAWGEGRKKILLVLDNPSIKEDELETPFSGPRGLLVKELLKEKLGLSIKKDCWVSYGVRCCSRKPIKSFNVDACRKYLHQDIEELKPKVIIPFGYWAMIAISGDILTSKSRGKTTDEWTGYTIPDQRFLTWIVPTWDIYQLNMETNKPDTVKLTQTLSHFENALRLLDVPVDKIDYEKRVIPLKTDIEIIGLLEALNTKAKENKIILALDYETTGKKPHRQGHEILSIAVSDGNKAWAFHYDKTDNAVTILFKQLLRSKNVYWRVHNVQFEWLWSKTMFGIWPAGLDQDTILGLHTLNSRKRKGLKPNVYCLFGVAGYDDVTEEFISATASEEKLHGANAFNLMKQIKNEENLLYNGLDALFTYLIAEYINKNMRKENRTGYAFLMKSAINLCKAQENGLRTDIDGVSKSKEKLTEKLDILEKQIQKAAIRLGWAKGDRFRPSAADDISKLVFNILGYTSSKTTPTGKPSVDKEVLEKIKSPVVALILEWKKLQKLRDTYINGLIVEVVDGLMRPFFNLYTVVTYRSSCLAKGTRIMVNRGYGRKNRVGIPIEEVKEGDYVFCFDDDLKPRLRKVLWAGKTGHKKVIRVWYKGYGQDEKYIDLTPDHKVRLTDGRYVRADQLLGDFRDLGEKNWRYKHKCSVLSMARIGDDQIYATHNIGINNRGILEHHLVYEERTSINLKESGLIIHHKDGDHFNHSFDNLKAMTLSTHAKTHVVDTLNTSGARINNLKVLKENHRLGVYKESYEKRTKRFSKTQLLRIAVKCRGDFTQLKDICPQIINREFKRNGIDYKVIKRRFHQDGRYISKNFLTKLINKHSLSKACHILKMDYYKYKRLCFDYGLLKGDQTHNHYITRISSINEAVDVYDITVDRCHNFIANEICVHNSNNPNFQNVPKRDKQSLKIIRSLLYPHYGQKLNEYDYKGIEVITAACYCKDKNLIKYVSDPRTDMHRDTGIELFMYEDNPQDFQKADRQVAKNKFVFPQFYGSYFELDAPPLWEMCSKEAKANMKLHGVRNLKDFTEHVREIENSFWNGRFSEYAQWKKDTYKFYLKHGYLDSLTGFQYYGPMKKNEALNICIQGSAHHVLLYTFNKVSSVIEEKRLKSKMIGQIHDSMIPSVEPEEENYIDKIIWYYGTQEIRDDFKWIIVPLEIEKSGGQIDESWAEMKEIGLLGVNGKIQK